jgi:GNAT superfamily N-acetyltransferase
VRNIQIRDFRIEDLAETARVWRDSWGSTGLAAGDDLQLERYMERLAGEGLCDWQMRLACRGTEIVGFLALERAQNRLRQIFVAPHVKRMGIGALLLDAAKREMPGGFWLWTPVENLHARHFYERRGLSADGEIRGDDGLYAIYRWTPQTPRTGWK